MGNCLGCRSHVEACAADLYPLQKPPKVLLHIAIREIEISFCNDYLLESRLERSNDAGGFSDDLTTDNLT